METLEITLIVTNVLVFISNIGLITLYLIGKYLRKRLAQIDRIQGAFRRGVPVHEILKMPMPKKLYKQLYEAYQKDLEEQENCPFEELKR